MFLGLVVVLLFWALGTRPLGWRLARVAGVVIAAIPILFVTYLTPEYIIGGAACMPAP